MQFKHPKLKKWALENRGLLINAVHTLVNAWIAAGKPDGKGSMGSFEDWAGVIGGILDVAGIPGFLGNLEEMYRQADPDAEAWREFVAAWWDELADRECKVSELNTLCETRGLLCALRGDKGLRSQEIRLGLNLNIMRDRVFGDKRIVAIDNASTNRGGRLYKLATEGEDTPGPNGDGMPDEEQLLVLEQTELPLEIPINGTAAVPKGEFPDVSGCCSGCWNGQTSGVISRCESNTSEGASETSGCSGSSNTQPMRAHACAHAHTYAHAHMSGGTAQTYGTSGSPPAEGIPSQSKSRTCDFPDVGVNNIRKHPDNIRKPIEAPSDGPPPDRGEAYEDPESVPPVRPDGRKIPDPWDPDYDPANDPYANLGDDGEGDDA